MNAVYVRKRNESLQWMWACLAMGEFLIWTVSGLNRLLGVEIFIPLLVLATPLLGISALIHYVFACQRYIVAKRHKHGSLIGVVILIFSFFASLLLIPAAFFCGGFPAAYVVVPSVFTLFALPLKLLPDRYTAESP